MQQTKLQVVSDMTSHVRWYPIMFFLFFVCMTFKMGADIQCFSNHDSSFCFQGMSSLFHGLFAAQPLAFCIIYLLLNPDEHWRMKMAVIKRYRKKGRPTKKVRFNPFLDFSDVNTADPFTTATTMLDPSPDPYTTATTMLDPSPDRDTTSPLSRVGRAPVVHLGPSTFNMADNEPFSAEKSSVGYELLRDRDGSLA